MKLFVTGATGFLGTWLVRHLVEKGHEISIMSRQGAAPEELSDLDLQIFKTDISDEETLKKSFLGHEGVFHLAGYIGYKKSERHLMEKVNVQGTQNVINACIGAKVRRLLNVSSVNAIGATKDRSLLNENSSYNLSRYHLGYSETKRDAEELVRKSCDRLDAVSVCPSTVYGPGDMKKGSRSMQVKIARGKFPFYTSGGVSIADVFEVCKAMLVAFEKGKTGERYILAGENLSIKAVFDLIAQEAGVAPPKIFLPNFAVATLGKLGDFMENLGSKGPVNSESAVLSQMYHWFSSAKAERELNYRITDAKTCIHNSVQWMKDNGWLNANL